MKNLPKDDPPAGEAKARAFPVHLLKPVSARLRGELVFNPVVSIPPAVWYTVRIDFGTVELGKHAYEPEVFGDKLEDATMSLGGIIVSERSWKAIDGEYGPVRDKGESSIYVSNTHVRISIEAMRLRRIGKDQFHVSTKFTIWFDEEESGYDDVAVSLDFDATFEGLGFHLPDWNKPVTYPSHWQIPRQFDARTVRTLFERFVDAGEYALERNGDSFQLRPRLD